MAFYRVLYTPTQLRTLKKSFDRFAAAKSATYHGIDLDPEWRNSFTEQVARRIVLLEKNDRARPEETPRGPAESGIVPASYLPKRYALTPGFPQARYQIYARGELRRNGVRTVRP